MTTSRETKISLDTTPYYHCISRCVRRAFLCGQDATTGKDFEHRKQWVMERLASLADVFAIDICAYAIMSNHIHLVLHINQDRTETWDNEEIKARVSKIFPRTLKKYDDWDEDTQSQSIRKWRKRLSNLSWFMRCLSEYIAKKSNREDNCTGRFWEGRFKSQALLDEGALLTCMAYVDLNPIRAGLSNNLEHSTWTSIQQRLVILTNKKSTVQQPTTIITKRASHTKCASHKCFSLPRLACFASQQNDKYNQAINDSVIPLDILEYIHLLEWTGRQVIPGK